MPPKVEELDFDPYNVAEMSRHGVECEDVIAVLAGRHRFFRNRRGRAATHLMVGPDASGRMLTVPIAPTRIRGKWRPVTAWPSSKGQITKYGSGS